MTPADKTTQRRLGYVEDLLRPRGTGRARVEQYRRRMERKLWQKAHSHKTLRHTAPPRRYPSPHASCGR